MAQRSVDPRQQSASSPASPRMPTGGCLRRRRNGSSLQPLLLLVALAMRGCASPAATALEPPHVLFVLADDLGWGNVGWHRETPTPEVKTPKLDQLVKDGIEMNRMYSWHACSPTRSSLQTGRLPIHVNAHNANPEIYNSSSASGTGAGIPRNMTGMAAKLAAAGYNTVFVGKWDAGMATPHHTGGAGL